MWHDFQWAKPMPQMKLENDWSSKCKEKNKEKARKGKYKDLKK